MMKMRFPCVWLAIVFLTHGAASSVGAEDQQKTALVGRSVTYEQVVIEGPELEIKPIDDETEVVVRIKEVYPHGSAFRYTFEVYGLEPGTFDVLDFLQSSEDVQLSSPPSITLNVRRTLPPGQLEPKPLEFGRTPWLGGYRTALIVIGIAWLAGLIWLIRVGRARVGDEIPSSDQTLSTADRLRPLVCDALAKKLDDNQKAVLERLLLAHWREQLKLTDKEPLAALAALREHEEAGSLLRSLEDWLHRPDPPKDVDVESLLRPYANVSSARMRDDEGTDQTSSREAVAP